MTKLGIQTNWMEYVQFMSSISPTIIGPSTFSHKILSQKGHRKWSDISRWTMEIQMEYKNSQIKQE